MPLQQQQMYKSAAAAENHTQDQAESIPVAEADCLPHEGSDSHSWAASLVIAAQLSRA